MGLGGGYMLPLHEGHQIPLVGLGITVKTNGKSTHGAYSLFELSIPPRTDGPPAHIHTREDESFICLAGKLDVHLGGQDFTLGPGDYLYMPRDVVHGFRNAYDEESRVISVVSPAGLEGYYQALADMPSDMAKLKRVNATKRFMEDFGIVLQLPRVNLLAPARTFALRFRLHRVWACRQLVRAEHPAPLRATAAIRASRPSSGWPWTAGSSSAR